MLDRAGPNSTGILGPIYPVEDQAMRVAIYARVSTEDRGQDPENQLAQLRAWCAAAGHEIVAEFVDHASGGKGADKRPQFAAMLDAAHRRQFDMLLVWALDRLTREGMAATVGYLQRLTSAGVAFHSYTEQHLSTENELVRDILLAVMASLAKVERQKISERTKAGLERVKAKGTKLGRPALDDRARTKITALARENPDMSAYAIAKAAGVDIKTALKYVGIARASAG
jgi:DNA invertase Pin-like site-specific DNA recombinase